MRQLGKLPNQEQTRSFVDYLLTEGIPARAEQDGNEWLIWVIQEYDVEKATQEFHRFRESPNDPRFLDRNEHAERLRTASRMRLLQAKKNTNVIREGPREKIGDKARRMPVTFALTAICILVALWTELGESRPKTDPFMFVSRLHVMEKDWDGTNPTDAMIDVRSGQLWRVLTPAIVHFGLLHLIFNMMWMHQLGGQIESRKGWLKYTLMILALAAFSNLVQIYVAKYPFFGGMSGVVYGLFGYVWIKSRFDPEDRFYINPGTVKMMLIWFAICFLPILPVANGGHGGGLVLGMAMGYLSSQMRR